MEKPAPRKTTSVDVHVAARLRGLRRDRKLSQARLADVLGVTFQQVQKYEQGSNRVSASTLWRVSQELKVPVSYFFEGLVSSVDEPDEGLARAMCEPSIRQVASRLLQLDEKRRTLVASVANNLPDGRLAD